MGIIIEDTRLDWSIFWTAASAISAVGVLFITGVYVWLTHRLAKAAESQIWQASRANVIASVVTNQGGQFFLLKIENIGSSPAENLQVYIDRPLHQQLDSNKPVTDAPFFKNGVASFPSNSPVKFGLGVSFRWLQENVDRSLHPVIFNVRVEYQTAGRYVSDVFAIDMDSQYSFSAMETDYLEEFGRTFPNKFERSLRDINRSIQQASKPPPKITYRRSWPDWFSQAVWKKRR